MFENIFVRKSTLGPRRCIATFYSALKMFWYYSFTPVAVYKYDFKIALNIEFPLYDYRYYCE